MSWKDTPMLTCRGCGMPAKSSKTLAAHTNRCAAFNPKTCPRCKSDFYGGSGHSCLTCDPVDHPKHYTAHPSGVECIEITRHMGFNLGNAVKCIWRAGEKGSAVEDLRKAVWYLQDEIKRLEKPA